MGIAMIVSQNKKIVTAIIAGGIILALIYVALVISGRSDLSYSENNVIMTQEEEKEVVEHIDTPEAVKAIYMTNWVGGSKKLRDKIVKLVEETELNSIVLDIKDYTGKVGFVINDPLVIEADSVEKRIIDIKEFIKELHEKNIYVIGRITVFQDPHLVKKRPELAVRRASDGGIWADRKGVTWLDPASKDVWKYIVAISKASYDLGFDELNYDYIRFPSDGNMKDIAYPFYNSESLSKSDQLSRFFSYLRANTKDEGIITSADIFGMTTTNRDDLNIGQILEKVDPHFDYIAPMVYPSHYPKGFNGHSDVNAVPYEIVKFSMDSAVERLIAASSSPDKLRPWLQDNDYPVHYTPEMVRAQIRATYDSGLDSWMLWDAANTYTRAALNASE